MDELMDEIRIEGIKGFGYHGLFPEEKKNGQEFIVDVTLHTDLSSAGARDDISATIDYGAVAARVKALIETDSYDLIERLATVIAERLKLEFSIPEVTITVHKPNAPVDLEFKDISVTIRR
jgi:dihydroneopterin aldolase